MFHTEQHGEMAPSAYQTYNKSMPTAFNAQSGAQSRIMFFMTRNNGLPVPLIPADELPFTIKLQHVPRVLNPEQTYGIQYVGNAPYTGSTFQLEREPSSTFPTSMPRSTSQPPGSHSEPLHARSQSSNNMTTTAGRTFNFLAPDALARQALHKRPLTAHETAKSWRRSDDVPSAATGGPTDPTQAVIDAILHSTSHRASSTSRTPPPSGVHPDQEKKEFCTHWILQGWCAYEQQGCRYKHEMLDREGLQKIGIRHVPRWWQERHAVLKNGGMGIVGVLQKPEEWLKSRKGSDAVSEESSTSDGSGESASTERTSEEGEEKKGFVEELVVRSKSPVVPATRPPTPAMDARKSSGGSDLIDFAPLLPTPSTSAASSSSSPRAYTPVQVLKRTIIKPQEQTNKVDMPSNSGADKPVKMTRVFVPAGESPEKHIAEFKQRERVVRTRSSPAPSPARATEAKVDVQAPAGGDATPKTGTKSSKIEDTKLKSEAKSPKIENVKPAGLLASRWAKEEIKIDSASGSPETKSRKLTKTGCRPRRPASSSPAAKACNTTTATSEKK